MVNAFHETPKKDACFIPCQNSPTRKKQDAYKIKALMAQATVQIASAARRRGSQVEHEPQCDWQHDDQLKLRTYRQGQGESQQQNAPPVPQNHFPRGVKVWATAMAVKMAPNAAQAAPISGSADQIALERTMPGEKQ